MSRNQLSLRLRGDLPASEEVTALLGVSPDAARRRGSRVRGSETLQVADVWVVTLIERSEWTDESPLAAATERAVEILRRAAPGLARLDTSRCQTELYLSTIRDEEMGGFSLPAEIVAAAGACNLTLAVSVLVMWSDDDEELNSEEGTP